MTTDLPPLPEPLVLVSRYGRGASTADGDGGLFTADQMRAYASQAVAAERERCASICEENTYDIGAALAVEIRGDKP